MSGPLLRSPVLWITGRPWFRRLAVGRLGRLVASRFVVGEALDDAIAAGLELGRSGIRTMLDHLGENVATDPQAVAAAEDYVGAIRRIRVTPGLDAQISVKLTQLGLDLSVDRCIELVDRVLAAAEGTLVMVDMESHEYVDNTLQVVRALAADGRSVGVCLQSYLRRSVEDVSALPEGMPIRLVKGAYLEPPDVAFPDRRDVEATFARLFATLAERGHPVHVATHDPVLIDGARRYVERRGIDWARVEFQMLYGIRRDLQRGLAEGGYPVRVYLPYGTEWYPYLTRRLAERPANMWFFVTQLARSGR